MIVRPWLLRVNGFIHSLPLALMRPWLYYRGVEIINQFQAKFMNTLLDPYTLRPVRRARIWPVLFWAIMFCLLYLAVSY